MNEPMNDPITKNAPTLLGTALEIQLDHNNILDTILNDLSAICERLGCNEPAEPSDLSKPEDNPSDILGRIKICNQRRLLAIDLIQTRIQWLDTAI